MTPCFLYHSPAPVVTVPSLRTLDFKVGHHPDTKKVEELEFELERLELTLERRRDRREMDWDEKREIREQVRSLKSEIKELETQIFAKVLLEAPVMVGTLTSARDYILRGRKFDLLVFDEATQATEPSSWIPILYAEKIVFAGDHFQLPPTVRSKKAEEGGLGVTLFERLYPLLGDIFKTLLRVQYRMNEKIMNFSSRKFYEGKLIADASVKNHTLADLPGVENAPETTESFLYIDTAGRGFEEALEPGSESKYNEEEAALWSRS